jgi:hypothetical protein
MPEPSCQALNGTARRRLRHAANGVIAGLIAMAGFAGGSSVLAATAPQRLSAHSAGLSCDLASAKRVKSALGITVGAPLVTRNGPVTVCQFMTKPALLVRFETNETASLFAAARKGFEQHGEPTKTLGGIGTKAFSSSIGSGAHATTTIVVLKNKTSLAIVAVAPLAKVVALGKLILPSL